MVLFCQISLLIAGPVLREKVTKRLDKRGAVQLDKRSVVQRIHRIIYIRGIRYVS